MGYVCRRGMSCFLVWIFATCKCLPVLSKGFEIETEMSIYAADKRMQVENVVIAYRDRPEGSESKLSTYSDGVKVLLTIAKMTRIYKSLLFYGVIALILAVISLVFFVPVLIGFASTGYVDKFPTLIMCGFTAITAIQALFTGLIL